MALVDDLVTAVLLAAVGFFVALAFGLLVRYRQASQRITESSDLGRDLWRALEQRMKKQDERILDVMARLEVVQARVLAAAASQVVEIPAPQPAPAPRAPAEAVVDVMPSPPTMQHPKSQPESQASLVPFPEIWFDETQLKVIVALSDGPKNTRQLTDAIGVSREHMARLMKELFEAGVVTRNDATKPFVYQLTDAGRQHLGGSPA